VEPLKASKICVVEGLEEDRLMAKAWVPPGIARPELCDLYLICLLPGGSFVSITGKNQVSGAGEIAAWPVRIGPGADEFELLDVQMADLSIPAGVYTFFALLVPSSVSTPSLSDVLCYDQISVRILKGTAR